MQKEIDLYVEHHNNTPRRANRHKILPHGVPDDIFEHPEEYGVPNFAASLTPNSLAP